jgi:hypothetical protein
MAEFIAAIFPYWMICVGFFLGFAITYLVLKQIAALFVKPKDDDEEDYLP